VLGVAWSTQADNFEPFPSPIKALRGLYMAIPLKKIVLFSFFLNLIMFWLAPPVEQVGSLRGCSRQTANLTRFITFFSLENRTSFADL